jgi:ribonuclease Z
LCRGCLCLKCGIAGLALVKVWIHKARLHDYEFAMRNLFLLCACATLQFAVPGPGYAQSFRVTLLGTGNPRPGIERFGPSTLVEVGNEKLLFDCGRGATQRIYQLKIPFSAVDALFLTHLHSDHTVGIPDLWLTGWIMGRGVALRVWGPAGTREMMSHLERAYKFDVHTRRDVDEKLPVEGAVIEAQEIKQGVVYESEGVKVTAFLVDHGLVQPAFGYRVDYAGHSVTLSGDTRFSENLIRFAQGTDLLIHEVIDPAAYQEIANTFTAAQRQKVIEHHITPEQAGVVFTRVKPKLAVFSHIVPSDAPDLIAHTRKTYSGPLDVGEDLTSIEIGQNIKVHRRDH